MESKAEQSHGPKLAGRLDLAYLRFDSSASVAGLRATVEQVQRYGFRSLCVPPVLAGTVKKNYPRLRVCAVVAYPLGTESLAAKTFAVSELAEQGIDEIDFVLDLFALVNDNWAKAELEVKQLGELCMRNKVVSKAIIETPVLTEAQIRRVAEIIKPTPVPFIKTSTGYHREPTSLDHVRLLRDVVGRDKMLKASGGIATYDQARAMFAAGADIIGTSNAAAIVEEARAVEQTVE